MSTERHKSLLFEPDAHLTRGTCCIRLDRWKKRTTSCQSFSVMTQYSIRSLSAGSRICSTKEVPVIERRCESFERCLHAKGKQQMVEQTLTYTSKAQLKQVASLRFIVKLIARVD
jgi:transcription-repair coupling factor (superfamily II helicase)